MPVLHILTNFHMAAVKGQEIEEHGDEASAVEIWTLIFTDRVNQDQVRISFRRDARDELVRQLTGGIVLAGGEFPRV
jgi:hypothetical protein